MALTINTNISSLMVQLSLKQSSFELDRALEQMTTGYRINSAKDDAAGYAVATKMAINLSSYNVAQDNAMLGTSLLSTATSSLDLVTTHLQRIRDLAEQAANGTYGNDSIVAIQAEIDQRTAEINRVMSMTEYNGIKLFEADIPEDGTGGTPTVDESKRVVNQTTFQSGQTYYITTSDDLVKLQDLVNSGVDTTNVTFELMSNINMQGVAFRGIGTGGGDGSDMSKVFKGTFNGNQHIISNLTINTSEAATGLFSFSLGDIQSLGLVNCNIIGANNVGAIVGANMGNISSCFVSGDIIGTEDYYFGSIVGNNIGGNISNCYSTASVTGYAYVGGLVGGGSNFSISKSYFNGNINGDSSVGGIVGYGDECIISNSYSSGEIKGNIAVGGFVGGIDNGNITNSYSIARVQGNTKVGSFVGSIGSVSIINGYFDKNKSGQTVSVGEGSYNGSIKGLSTSELQDLINNGTLPKYDYSNGVGTVGGGNWNNTGREFSLQIGIDSTVNSQITFDTALGFALDIDVSTTDSARNALDEIDEVLDLITAKQTEFGAVQNRLDSVLDSLSVSIENTTSSLSTIKDADIAKVSADYIRAQILQQASSSLLATANQAPSIALNLI